MSQALGRYAVDGDTVVVLLPAPLGVLCQAAGVVMSSSGGTPFQGPGPLVTVSTDIALADPLAVLEAEHTAAALAQAADSARSAQDEFIARVLASAQDGEIAVRVKPDQLIELSNWFNRAHITVRVELEKAHPEIGAEQNVFDDAALDGLLGRDPQQDPYETIGLLPAVLAVLAIELLHVHREVQASSQ